ncbi:MAG TPA: tetratricopeptide repeat protein, partial [Chthoniobacterales bacterium]|nr:tetratricopeptide repeat protein [Chthoniobacterales bacterium]
RQPNNRDRHRRLRDDLTKLANLQLDLGAPASARQAYNDVFVADQRWLNIMREIYMKASTDSNKNDLAQAYGDAGWHGLLAGRAKEAMPFTEAALALRPETPWVIVNLGHAYLFLGRYAEALEQFRSVRDRDRGNDGKRKYAHEIKDDFVLFRRLGLALAEMDRVERDLGLAAF